MDTKDLENTVKNLSTTNLSIMHHFLTTEVEKRIKEKIKEISPDTHEVKLPYPYTPLEELDGITTITGIKLNKFLDDYDVILVMSDDSKTTMLSPLFDLNNSINLLEILDDITYRAEYEKKSKRPIHFENEDIIITDPCYIINNDNDDDWEKCEYGDNMEVLGINNYKVRDTIYGDWSCTTFNSDTKEPIGEFCADAGLVGVFSLKEVLKYNPKFDYHTNRKWTTTLIKNFTGDVWFEVEPYVSDGYESGEVHVVGKGNINFETRQTGL